MKACCIYFLNKTANSAQDQQSTVQFTPPPVTGMQKSVDSSPDRNAKGNRRSKKRLESLDCLESVDSLTDRKYKEE